MSSDAFDSFLSRAPEDTDRDVEDMRFAAERAHTIAGLTTDDYVLEYQPLGLCGVEPGWYQFTKNDDSGGMFNLIGNSAREVAKHLHGIADALERHLKDPDLLRPDEVMRAQLAALMGDEDAKSRMMAIMIKMRSQHKGRSGRMNNFLDSLGDVD